MLKRTIPNEHKLIFLCARLEIKEPLQQEIKELLLNSSTDWRKIIEISNLHGTLPFLYYNIKKLDLQNIIPQDILAEMKNCYYSNLNRNLMIEKEISFILELTNREGISIIPLKGFSLMQTLYHNPGLRIMVDVDILIKENNFQKIRNILNHLDYQENIEDISKKHLQKYRYNTVFSKTFSSNQFLNIDIHPAIDPPRPYKINLPCLWQRTQKKTVNSQRVLYLSQEDTLLSIALHLRRHTQRLSLKFIIDITELLNTNRNKLDWLYIMKSAKDNRIISAVYFSLYITGELLSSSISPEILNKFRLNIIKRTLIGFSINKYNFFTLKKWRRNFLRFLLFDNLMDFLIYLRQASFLERFVGSASKKLKKLLPKNNHRYQRKNKRVT